MNTVAVIYNQSQLAERKHVACYWSINTVVTAVLLIAHPSPIELLIKLYIPASIKLTLVIRTKLAAAILGEGLFGGNDLRAQYCPCGQYWFWRAACYSVSRTCSRSTLLMLF